jgi:O-antigen/teichoic acid export membrane protein
MRAVSRRLSPLRALFGRSRSLASHTIWAAGGDVVLLGSSLVVFYLLTTRLGPSGYGYFIGAQVLVATLATFCAPSAGMLLMQEIVRERRAPKDVWQGCLGLALLTGAVGVLASLPLAALLLPGLSLLVVALFALAQFFGAGLVALGSTYEQSQGRLPRGVVLTSTVNGVRAAAVLLLATIGDLSLMTVALTFLAVNAVFAVATVALLRVRYGLPVRPRLPSWPEGRRGLSYAGALLSFAVQEDADKVLLVPLASPAANGLYATAYRFVQMATLPIRALVMASHPRFLRHDDDALGQHVRRTFRATGVAVGYAVVASVVLVAGAPLVATLLGGEYADAVHLVYLLTPLVLLRAVGLFAFNGLMGLGRNGVRLVLVACCAVLNAVLNIGLILAYGAVGAAVATLLSEAVFVIGSWGALLWYQRVHDKQVLARREREQVASM